VGAGAYDSLAGRTTPGEIQTTDIQALNRTMRARTQHVAWAELVGVPLPWLERLPLDLDLIEADDHVWQRDECPELLRSALRASVGKGRGVSVSTKMLHLKRPRLFPVLDQLVAEVLGGGISPDAPAATRAEQAVALALHVRQEGRRNLMELRRIQAALADAGIERSLVRILDATLWMSHPATSLPATQREFGCKLA
jgi:hypothetical protein